MPVLYWSSKAIKRLLPGQGVLSFRCGLGWMRGSLESSGQCGQLSQIRCLSSIARIETPTIDKLINKDKALNRHPALTVHSSLQSRWFLGCGDGEEGNSLSKTYEEKRIIGYSPEQLFAVVAAVDLYEDFVPWCQRSRIIRRNVDGTFDAELVIGFKFLVESYISHVELKKPKFIKTSASESRLFEYLINIWEFNPGPVPGTCDLHFFVDFKFQSPLYRQVASVFFQEVVSRLVYSFTDHCRTIYGPGVRVLESSYERGS